MHQGDLLSYLPLETEVGSFLIPTGDGGGDVVHVAHALSAMVFFFLFLFLFAPLFAAFLLTVYVALCKPGCAVSAADTSSV